MGEKTWITGQDNAQFGAFWDRAHRGGLIERLRAQNGGEAGAVTKATTFGVSCVEKNPNDRAFYFYIAAEYTAQGIKTPDQLESYEIPACTWAVFSNRGELPMSLVNAEMYAFMEWLPASGYAHALAPELEVYPAHDSKLVEFWLPIQKQA